MAIDLNREIRLSDLGRRGRGAGDVPSKTTMNLYQPNAGASRGSRTWALLAVLAALLVGAGVKFGVVDQFARADAAEARLVGLQEQVDAMEAQLTDYDEVVEDYAGYTAQFASTDVDIDDVFDLVENAVMVYSTVQSMDLQDNSLTLRFTDVALDVVGRMAYSVNTYPIARAVNVSTAESEDDVNQVTSTMTVTLMTTGDAVAETTSGEVSQSDLFSNLDTDGHNVVPNVSFVGAAGLR